MYLFTRAINYIKKQKARTILMLVLFLVIANIVLAGLSMKSAADTAEANLKAQIGANVTYSLNTRQVMTDTENGTITKDTDRSTLEGAPTYSNFLSLSNSQYVASSDAVSTYEVNTDTITPYTNSTSSSSSSSTDKQAQNGQNGEANGNIPREFISGTYENAGDLTLTTFTSTKPTAFVDGTSTLTEGRFATQDEINSGAYVVLIEKTLAEKNNISVGDKIQLTPVISGVTTSETTYEVIGIYETSEQMDSRMSQMVGSSLLPQNNLYTPYLTLKNIGLTDEQLNSRLLDSATFTMNDPDKVDAFEAEAAKTVTLTYGSLSTGSATYSRISASISSISGISSTLVLIVSIAGAAILALITALTVSQRKNEIGILLSIGESKLKIVTQLLTEVLIIAVIAFSLSIFTGTYIGKAITDTALSNTTSVTNAQNGQMGGFNQGTASGGTTAGNQTQGNQTQEGSQTNGYSGNSRSTTALATAKADINVELNLSVVLELFLAGILISMVSVAIPALYVTRFNPKQILTNNG